MLAGTHDDEDLLAGQDDPCGVEGEAEACEDEGQEGRSPERRAPDEAAIAVAMPKALTVFNELAHLLGDMPFFAGDTVSLADLMVAPAVEFFTLTPEWSDLGAPHANLVAWLERMQERPSMKTTTWERVSELAQAA